jgi:hypothetical protein
MISDTRFPDRPPGRIAGEDATPGAYVDWEAILAGEFFRSPSAICSSASARGFEGRDIRRARRLRQSKALARRYVQTFPTASDDIRVWPDRAERDTGSGPQVFPQMPSD